MPLFVQPLKLLFNFTSEFPVMRSSVKLFLVISVVWFSGCVSSRKYNALEESKALLEREYDALRSVRDQLRELESSHRALGEELAVSKQERDRLEGVIRGLEQGRDDLTKRLDDLMERNQTLLTATVQEKQALVDEILSKEQEIVRRLQVQDSLASVLDKRERKLDELTAEVAAKQARLDDLGALLKQRETALAELKAGLLQVFKGYSSTDLSVREENGRVYVSLSQNLLFPSGSDKLDPKGVKALQQLAGVLKNKKDMDILVEGHTDTDGSADLNWDLSTGRATSVVKILVREGVDPAQVTAAGRAFFLPVAANDTPANKARNRRVEIILAPQWEKILQMLGGTEQ